jgi:hypothetical protein
MSLSIVNIIKTKIKKLYFLTKLLDKHKSTVHKDEDDDTDKDDYDFSSFLYDTRTKTKITIIEVLENYSINKIIKSLEAKSLNNPEFILFDNYIIHLRFFIINNKNYLIIIIDTHKDYQDFRDISTNIIQNFDKFDKFLINPLLFEIDYDIFSNEKSIQNLHQISRTSNKIQISKPYNEYYYSYDDGIFNYFIQLQKNNLITYYYYRLDRYIFNPIF